MLSLKQFRRHAYPMFDLMEKTGHVFEIVHNGVVYDLHVAKTNRKPKLSRAKMVRDSELQDIEVTFCPDCNEIMFSGICMNTKCAQ